MSDVEPGDGQGDRLAQRREENKYLAELSMLWAGLDVLREDAVKLRQRIAELEAERDARKAQLAEMRREMRALATPIARAVMLEDFEDVLDRYFPPEEDKLARELTTCALRNKVAVLETAVSDIERSAELLAEDDTRAAELAAVILRRIDSIREYR